MEIWRSAVDRGHAVIAAEGRQQEVAPREAPAPGPMLVLVGLIPCVRVRWQTKAFNTCAALETVVFSFESSKSSIAAYFAAVKLDSKLVKVDLGACES